MADIHYPRFIEQAEKWMNENPEYRISNEALVHADERFYNINQAFYDDKLMIENNLSEKSMDEIVFEHTLRLQEFFEDTFGEDAWDDRHEIYTEVEG
jgi:hypothetical protein